jgi:2-oxoacid:acceptor oxidoreductase delta subunit (pyruvate/2-ketoisovalerate family)
MLRYGIPMHRLPREVLDEEVEDIKSLGVELRCGVPVGNANGMSFDDLGEYDAVFLAVGAYGSRPLGIEGEKAERVVTGLDVLRQVARGDKPAVGKRAAVIGGGNTALDAARVLVRLGVEVDIYYRRGRAEMPAFEEEIEEALREGVHLHTLVAPVKIELDDAGAVRAVSMTRMRLGDPDESGRRRPVVMEDSEHEIEADTVVACVGELVEKGSVPDGLDCARDGSVNVGEFGHSSLDKVWAGGDVTPNDRTVVSAIGMGKRAAVAIDRYLAGAPTREVDAVTRVGRDGCVSMSLYLGGGTAHQTYDAPNKVVAYDELNMAHFKRAERAREARAGFPERLDGFPEVNQGLEEPHARAEAGRCFHCGVCTDCDNCYVFCPDVAILPKQGERGYDLNYDFCKGCGICVTECPRASMTMVEE